MTGRQNDEHNLEKYGSRCLCLSPMDSALYETWRLVLNGRCDMHQVVMTCCCTNSSFEFEYLREFEIEFKNILGYEEGVQIGSINGKIQRLKISCYCPFKVKTVEKSTSIFTDLHEFRGSARQIYGSILLQTA